MRWVYELRNIVDILSGPTSNTYLQAFSVRFNVALSGYVPSGVNFEVNTLCLRPKVKDWVFRIARGFCWVNCVFV